MSEGTAATESSAALPEVFALYSARLTRYVYDRLERADWHLAEDIASEVFLNLVRGYADRPIRRRTAFALLKRLAQCRIADHYRLRRSGERAADFSARVEEARLPASPGAGDVAMARIEARRELAELPEPTTPAARRRVEALTVMAVAA
jgi:DNA-directed RNA polymerase specialized sigma24 family protein